MRNLIIILMLSSLFACNQKFEKSDSPIEKFERILGEQETIDLNEIVYDLDNYLAFHYPDNRLKFKAYLGDISKSKVEEYWKIDSTKLIKYRENYLFGKYDTIFPDSVWYNGQSFSIKFPNSDFIEETIPIISQGEIFNLDSAINSLKNEPKFSIRKQGKLYLALVAIQQSDSIILTYFDAKVCAGNISPSILAGGLACYLNDKNELFAKSILILDMYERRKPLEMPINMER